MAVEGDVLTDEIAKLEKVLRKQFTGQLPQKIMEASLNAAARVVVQQARQPGYAFNDRTGKLRRTIKVSTRRGGRRGSRRGGGTGVTYDTGVRMGGAGARQGVLIELGTEKMKARAPLRRAINDTFDEQVAAMRAKGNEQLVEYVRELNSGALRPSTRQALVS